MNVVFISPHFPLYFHNFCNRLKEKGVHVLGIGDATYQELSLETKQGLTEYYHVSSLENFEEVYRGVAFYISKYGRMDYIESQNEYWLETEAKLRTAFDVNSGTKFEHLAPMKYKSKMKKVYQDCGIPVARYILDATLEEALAFTKKVGYPVVVKPDNGVGAISTYKLKNDEEVEYFYQTKEMNMSYIMEEYVNGHVETFDGVSDVDKNILICSSHVMLTSIMDNVNEASDTAFYSQIVKDSDIKEIGTKVVQAFDTRSRFFHFEFFRLSEDKKGLGKKGDLVGLEVNMRAPGAYMPDMINYAYDCDVYALWADMLLAGKMETSFEQKYVVGYIGRRNGIDYSHALEQVREEYKENIVEEVEVPAVLSAAMANHVFLVRTKTTEELFSIIRYVLQRNDGSQWI